MTAFHSGQFAQYLAKTLVFQAPRLPDNRPKHSETSKPRPALFWLVHMLLLPLVVAVQDPASRGFCAKDRNAQKTVSQIFPWFWGFGPLGWFIGKGGLEINRV